MSEFLDKLRDSIGVATREMNAQDFARRPAEGKWSTAEILEHLALTYKGTAKNLERSLTAERPLGGAPTLKQRAINLLVLDLGYFPSGRNSPESARPKGIPNEKIVDEINRALATMRDVIEKCETKFGDGARAADHPVLGPITMRQWRKFHWLHGRHHLKQIEQMRKR
jgi:hypothetical protein